MKSIKQLLLPLCMGVLLAVPFESNAKGKGRGGYNKGKMSHRLWAQLNLTDEQKTKLKELHEEMLQIRKDHYQKVNDFRIKMKDELLKEKPSRQVLSNYAQQLGALHQDLTQKRTEHLLDIKGVLTPEQFTKVVDKDWKGRKAHCAKGTRGCHAEYRKGTPPDAVE